MLRQGYILLGVLNGETYRGFNRAPDETVLLSKTDMLIVLGEK